LQIKAIKTLMDGTHGIQHTTPFRLYHQS